MGRTQYIFVDYENVPDVDLPLIAGKPVVVELVLGEQHKALPVPMVDRLMEYRDQIRLVKAGKSGRNALDFVLAYRVGVTTAAHADAYIHIVSRDTGFDALIAHLRAHKIPARRDETFAKAFEIEPPRVPVPTAKRPQVIIERPRKSKINRPKRKATLLSHINSHFGNKLTAAELEALVQTLITQQAIEVGAKGT